MSKRYYTGPITAETPYIYIENSRPFQAAVHMHWTLLKMICRYNLPSGNDIYLLSDTTLATVRRHSLYSITVRHCVIKFCASREGRDERKN